jgi:ABC-2 type transport system ATP-binding protein
MNVIESDGIVKQYDGVRALDAVSFAVGKGEVFALVGPNGAGKTTLLRLLTEILRPDEGTLRLFGTTRLRDVLGQIGYMPEERGLYKALSPLDTVTYFARLKGLGGKEARAAAERALEAVGMMGHARRKLEELSKGMSQRVQFAATIAHDPQLLILDEPFSGLDPVSARDLQQLILHQRDTGHTILLSTHNMEHAERLADRLLMLHRGQVRLYGSIGEIKERYRDDSLLVQYGGPLPEVPGVRVEPVAEGMARLYPSNGTGRREILAALVAGGADIHRFEPVVPTLEDIFIQVAGAEGEKALRETQAVG